jgi:hypothetical protein
MRAKARELRNASEIARDGGHTSRDGDSHAQAEVTEHAVPATGEGQWHGSFDNVMSWKRLVCSDLRIAQVRSDRDLILFKAGDRSSLMKPGGWEMQGCWVRLGSSESG